MTTETAAVKGLTLHVYRDAGRGIDCTNGGITATATRVTLVGLTAPDLGREITRLPEWQISEPSPDAPPVVAVINRWRGSSRYAYLAPVEITAGEIATPRPGRFMFGGNFAATDDSRFSGVLAYYLNNDGPDILRVYDRIES